MMLFLHLFNKPADVFGYQSLLFVGETPLANWLAHAANPVAFFLILSGYGLSFTHHRRGFSLRAQGRRVGRLFVQYWVALAVFAGLVAVFVPGRFAFDVRSLWLNVSCLQPTYNLTLWFLFPYCLLSLTSGALCRCYDRLPRWVSVGGALLLYLASSFLLATEGNGVLARFPLLNQAVLYAYLLFPFLLGVMMERWVAAGRSLARPRLLRFGFLPLLCLLALILLRCRFDHTIVNPFYAFPFILLFLWMRRPVWLDGLLAHLGKYSLMMWMCHKFLFEDLLTRPLFSLGWPPLIFAALVLASWACAVPLQTGANRLAGCIPFLSKPAPRAIKRDK